MLRTLRVVQCVLAVAVGLLAVAAGVAPPAAIPSPALGAASPVPGTSAGVPVDSASWTPTAPRFGGLSGVSRKGPGTDVWMRVSKEPADILPSSESVSWTVARTAPVEFKGSQRLRPATTFGMQSCQAPLGAALLAIVAAAVIIGRRWRCLDCRDMVANKLGTHSCTGTAATELASLHRLEGMSIAATSSEAWPSRLSSAIPFVGASSVSAFGASALKKGPLVPMRARQTGLLIPPDACRKLLGQSRAAHWVLRASDLSDTVGFLEKVFGMKAVRHEEHEQHCVITCNGSFKTPWSKTMIGYGREDQGYCIELTYNYGVSAYDVSTGLAEMAIGVESPEGTLALAASAGYQVHEDTVTGPDGYRFRVLQQQQDRQERFQYAALRVADVSRASAFYEEVLGMQDLSTAPIAAVTGKFHRARVLGYDRGQVPLVLFEDASQGDVRPRSWDGRHAICIPGKALRAVMERISEHAGGGRILHDLREFNEHPVLRRTRGLPPMPCRPAPEDYLRELRSDRSTAPAEGTLAVMVITDVDGYEICLASAETYDAQVANAYDPECSIDWAWRREALAGRRTPTRHYAIKCV